MAKKGVMILTVVSTLLIFGVVSVMLFQMETKKRRLPYLGRVADFSLSDSDGEDFGLEDLQRKVWVASFIFTTCGDVCPKMSNNMASLHRSYELEPDVSMVSISVNPEYDNPAVLQHYAKAQNANTDRWHFLTGPRAAIKELTLNSFKLGSIEEPIFHSGKFVLVDRNANIRGYYEGTEKKEVDQLFHDIAMLRKER